jgi:hypothetical protein
MTHDAAIADAIPPPLADDDDDVAWALQTAAVQWKRGLYADALVWLERAVESAIEIGNPARASELQQRAAALSAYVPAQAPPEPAAGRLSIEIDFDQAPERPPPPPPPRRPPPPPPPRPLPPPRSSAPNPFLVAEPAPPAFPPSSPPEELPRFPSSIDDDELPQDGAPRVEQLPYQISEAPELPRFPTPSEEGLPRFPSAREAPIPEPTEPYTEPLDGELAPNGAYEAEPLAAPPSYEEYVPAAEPIAEPATRESLPEMIAEAAPLASQPPPAEPVQPAEHAEPAAAPGSALAERHEPTHEPEAADEAEPRIGDVSLGDVTGLQDLPPQSQAEFARLARIERLAAEEETSAFAVALVLEGEVALMPTIADVACARAATGEVVFTHGSLEEAIALRVVAGDQGAAVAIWDSEAWLRATADCPWVADELRILADRFQALAGASMGALGDRFDESLREAVTSRCQVKALLPGEVLVEAGSTVPGMQVIGGGRIELTEADGDGLRVVDELGPGDFLFPEQVLSAGKAPQGARAARSGALMMYADRMTAHELLVSVPPLIELLAG